MGNLLVATTVCVVLSYIDNPSQFVNLSGMKKQNEKIVQAALQVFMRYGIRRTTMNDIAREAGLVRQTLYTVYSSKDEVLCAAIRYFSDQIQQEVEARWQQADSLGQKLDVYFEQAIVASFRMIRASPEAGDMIDGYSAAGKAEILRGQARKAEAIAGILQPFEAAILASGLSVSQLATFVQCAALGLRNSAGDEAELAELLAALRASVLSLTGG
jgi:AcrR family transcriptional regulator